MPERVIKSKLKLPSLHCEVDEATGSEDQKDDAAQRKPVGCRSHFSIVRLSTCAKSTWQRAIRYCQVG